MSRNHEHPIKLLRLIYHFAFQMLWCTTWPMDWQVKAISLHWRGQRWQQCVQSWLCFLVCGWLHGFYLWFCISMIPYSAIESLEFLILKSLSWRSCFSTHLIYFTRTMSALSRMKEILTGSETLVIYTNTENNTAKCLGGEFNFGPVV